MTQNYQYDLLLVQQYVMNLKFLSKMDALGVILSGKYKTGKTFSALKCLSVKFEFCEATRKIRFELLKVFS